MPTPVLEQGHDPPVGELLNSVGRGVAVLRTVGHVDHQLRGADQDPMLSSVQWATVEDRNSRDITIRGRHLADTATVSNGIAWASPAGEPEPVQERRGFPLLAQVPYGRVRTSMLWPEGSSK